MLSHDYKLYTRSINNNETELKTLWFINYKENMNNKRAKRKYMEYTQRKTGQNQYAILIQCFDHIKKLEYVCKT